MKRLIANFQYNVHDIVNQLYRTVPLVPTGNLLQDIAQDIQNGLYNDCGDPNENWNNWRERCTEILSERNIINIMQPRQFINAEPIISKDCKYIREAKLKKISNEEYTWEEVCNIINNAGGSIYSSPFGNYSDCKFKLKTILINDISKDCYLSIEDCKKYDLDEDENVIMKLVDAYNNGASIPPIILDNNLKIIDGSHRLGMYDFLGINKIQAFILQEKEV